jgi:hypothetical protein
MNYRVSLWEFLGNNRVTKLPKKAQFYLIKQKTTIPLQSLKLGLVSLYLGWDKF